MSNRLESFRRFVGELSRRRVFRTAALYVIFAVVAVEATEALVEPLDLPLRTLPMVAWAAILGFPIAVGLAWTFDVTPRGIVRTPPDSEENRRRRRMSTQVGFRLTLTGIAAAVVGATTWVVMEPFIPRVPEPEPVPVGDSLPGTVLVPPVAGGEDVAPELASRARLLLVQRLSELPGVRPVDPRTVDERLGAGAEAATVARELGVQRILEVRIEQALDGIRLSAELRDLSGGTGTVRASAVGPPESLDDLVARVTTTLHPDAVEGGGARD